MLDLLPFFYVERVAVLTMTLSYVRDSRDCLVICKDSTDYLLQELEVNQN